MALQTSNLTFRAGSRFVANHFHPPVGIGGGVRNPKRVCVRKVSLKFPVTSVNFIFFHPKLCLMVGGWIGWGVPGSQTVPFLAGSMLLSHSLIQSHDGACLVCICTC